MLATLSHDAISSRLTSFLAASVREYAMLGRGKPGFWINLGSFDIPAISDRLSILREPACFEEVVPNIHTDGDTLRVDVA